MSGALPWRAEIEPLVRPAFLRLGREKGTLLVSDYPRRAQDAQAVTQALEAKDFTVDVRQGIAYIDGTEQKYRKITDSLPPGSVTAAEENLRLYALHNRLLHAQGDAEPDTDLLRPCLRALDSGRADEMRELPALLAERQRLGKGLPRKLAALLAAFCRLHSEEVK